MHPLPTAPPADLALGRIVCAAADMLERELTPLFEDYLDGERNRWGEPRFEAARHTCRLMLLCRSLIEEIQRHEHLRVEDDLNF
jgi:hypothetical protein